MTGLELLTLVVDRPNATAGAIAELAVKRELMAGEADGRRLSKPLRELAEHGLITETFHYRGITARRAPSTYVPTRTGRVVLGAVKRARSAGFVPYSQISGVGPCTGGVLARAV